MQDKFKYLIRSRKFWAALIGLLLVVFRAFFENFPLDDEAMLQAILVIISYIMGTALEDAGTKKVPA